MNCTKQSTRSSIRGFEDLPVELSQVIMCHLALKDLEEFILLSSRVYAIFMGARGTILHDATANELGFEIFTAAAALYACSHRELRPCRYTLVAGSCTSSMATKIHLRGHTQVLDIGKFQIPKTAFTASAVKEIISTHREVEEDVKFYGDLYNVVFSTIDAVRIQLAIYMGTSATLLFPMEYRDLLESYIKGIALGLGRYRQRPEQ
ncbi:hypothetical protein F5Y13DRAFT_192369 [Hypoxylon sp. FL1857]|nr:hypothetical protein F5Y13DRAFT_192369 [Hypoxylon sp. FL1857]